MDFSSDASTVITILNLSFAFVGFALVDAFTFLFLNRWSSRITILVTEVAALCGWMFKIDLLMIIGFVLWAACLIFFCFVNLADIRALLSNSGKHKGALAKLFQKHGKHAQGEQLFDREEMYRKVENAVLTLSRQKIGALITFERSDDLSDIMKNGTLLNAPVTSELLQTIFYPGTRLHDGAVIIRDDKIAAASVYFSPTNRPLTGKFGSRHRAAYGISETSDSVTILVSEETGRISVAFQGELTPVTPDNLMRIFKEDMETIVEKDEEK